MSSLVIIPEPFAKDNPTVMLMIALYAFFSFITTFISEIVKDIEDLEETNNKVTIHLPVV
ncbi:MAG: hypothetical protein IPJ26_17430 [Bacteroidetes bacterium]|nr:hypothetical protein [Bacteroidota bacterium]